MKVPFSPGRTDASQAQTDVDSFAVLEPRADGFRNYIRKGLEGRRRVAAGQGEPADADGSGDDGADGGMRALGCKLRADEHGVFTERPGTLSNDFFVNLLDMKTKWQKSAASENVLEGRDRATGELKWTGTMVDLVFGSNSQLRALAEVYARSDGEGRICGDFAAAWTKVMNLDRFDLA